MVLDKDRKIIQKEKELYKVVFDANGFSVHDLALLGQKNSEESLFSQNLKTIRMGRVNLINDFSPYLLQKASTTSTKSTKSAKKGTVDSNEEFEIVQILDYVDDLYLLLLDPEHEAQDDGANQSTSEGGSSKK